MITTPDLMRLIPHRKKMLLVDRVVELVPGDRAVAHKAVSYGESWYQRLGDDPGHCDFGYPHALLLESFNQACAALVMATWGEPGTDVLASGVPMLASYGDVEFGRRVLPGEVVEHRVRVIRVLADAMALEGESVVGTDVVLKAARGMVVRRSAALLRARLPEERETE